MDRAGRRHLSRRSFIGRGTALGVAAIWKPAWRIDSASGQIARSRPPNFPSGIALYRQAYVNWAQQVRVDDLWTCAPRTSAEVVAVANWAASNGFRIRARGMRHGWSPLTVTPGPNRGGRLVLVDTTQHLTRISIRSTSPGVVRAQAGATMDSLLAVLQAAGLGMTATPGAGDITLGGALAIDGHGTAVPVGGVTPPPGHTYGSVTNLVTSLTAVVWDPRQRRYGLRRFERSDPQSRALLVHLGRMFVTEAELRVGANANLRCQSFVDIPAAELFAAPGASSSRTFASYVEQSGRAEAIWFPFTDRPWLKVWTVSPRRPAGSREVSGPYNYTFSDDIPLDVSEQLTTQILDDMSQTPAWGQEQYAASAAGLAANAALDIWGPSKDLLLYIRPTTIRTTANGYAIICRRSHIQRVVSEFATFYSAQLAAYQARGSFPVNMPAEIRVTGLDHPDDVGVSGATSPVLSALRPRPDHPEWNVAVWIDALTFVDTPDSNRFYSELESWIFKNYSAYACVRPEWSKGWAFTHRAGWSNAAVLAKTIPNAFRAGRRSDDNWDWQLRTLDCLDPYRIFTNAFLERLMPATMAPPTDTPAVRG